MNQTEFLKCKLTDSEIQIRGQEMAALVEESKALELTKKHTVQGFNDQLKELDGRIGFLASVVKSGVERRPVEVFERQDWAGKRVLTIRTDTGETVRERPMTSDELQLDLFADEAAEVVVELFEGRASEDETPTLEQPTYQDETVQ